MQRWQQPFHHLLTTSTTHCDSCSKLGCSFLPVPGSDTAARFPLTNKPHNNFFLFFKHMSPGDFLHRPAPGASPRAHVHSLGVDQGSTNPPSQVSVLFLIFFPVDKWIKTLFMCPSNLETREIFVFVTNQDPHWNIRLLLLQKYGHCPAHGAELHLAAVSVKAVLTAQPHSKNHCQGKIHLLTLTYYLFILVFPFPAPHTKKLRNLHVMSPCAIMI